MPKFGTDFFTRGREYGVAVGGRSGEDPAMPTIFVCTPQAHVCITCCPGTGSVPVVPRFVISQLKPLSSSAARRSYVLRSCSHYLADEWWTDDGLAISVDKQHVVQHAQRGRDKLQAVRTLLFLRSIYLTEGMYRLFVRWMFKRNQSTSNPF